MAKNKPTTAPKPTPAAESNPGPVLPDLPPEPEGIRTPKPAKAPAPKAEAPKADAAADRLAEIAAELKALGDPEDAVNAAKAKWKMAQAAADDSARQHKRVVDEARAKLDAAAKHAHNVTRVRLHALTAERHRLLNPPPPV